MKSLLRAALIVRLALVRLSLARRQVTLEARSRKLRLLLVATRRLS